MAKPKVKRRAEKRVSPAKRLRQARSEISRLVEERVRLRKMVAAYESRLGYVERKLLDELRLRNLSEERWRIRYDGLLRQLSVCGK